MKYTVRLHLGIYYQTNLGPNDKLKRVEYRDKHCTTHVWIKQ